MRRTPPIPDAQGVRDLPIAIVPDFREKSFRDGDGQGAETNASREPADLASAASVASRDEKTTGRRVADPSFILLLGLFVRTTAV
jgi:hypothetical protein